MYRLVFISFILFSVTGKSSAVKWVELTAGDPLPPDAVFVPEFDVYIGRARHFNDILFAKVLSDSSATIETCGKKITKHKFEVLTSTKSCIWQPLQIHGDLPEDLLLVGRQTAPIFISWLESKMEAFSLNAYEIERLFRDDSNVFVLVCPTERVWVDVSAKETPENAVLAGETREGSDMFVARLKKDCRIYPGQVVPEEGVATAWADEELIEERYCQVLIGDSDQYSWVSITDDKFPDNAVVGSANGHNLYYVAKYISNNTAPYLTHVTSLFMKGIEDYEILVENVKDVESESSSNLS